MHQIWEWLIHSDVCQNPDCSDFQLNPLWNQPRPKLTLKRCAGAEVVMEQPNFSENVRTCTKRMIWMVPTYSTPEPNTVLIYMKLGLKDKFANLWIWKSSILYTVGFCLTYSKNRPLNILNTVLLWLFWSSIIILWKYHHFSW